ncbi:hypothetical protein [Polynucleobacter necessarius]|uniref:hypothetical protein n=1 Tax=Polynucleobacter necessarius TaxID=576610 RepID=UPI000E09C3E6|nr:hypothetical protein [Polynucleobacter necessarius]
MPSKIINTVDAVEVAAKIAIDKHGWALSALSEAAAALARADSQDLLIQEVCGAIAAPRPLCVGLGW